MESEGNRKVMQTEGDGSKIQGQPEDIREDLQVGSIGEVKKGIISLQSSYYNPGTVLKAFYLSTYSIFTTTQ